MNTDDRILVIDENPLNRLLVQSLLESGGYRSDTATDGPEAVEAVLRRHYALILLDLTTRDAALELVTSVKALGGRAAAIPILALSAEAPADRATTIREAGLSGSITKPVDPPDLLARIAEWLGSRDPAADEPAPDAIDQDQLTAVRVSMTPEAFDALLANYLSGARGRLARIEGMIEAGDMRVLQHEAHDLTSTSGSFGITGLARLAKRLEQACKANDRPAARELATALRAAADPVWDGLER